MATRGIVPALGLVLSLIGSWGCAQAPQKAARTDDKPTRAPAAEADVSPIQTVAVVPLLVDAPESAWLGEAIASGLGRRLFDRQDLGSYTTRQVEAGMRQARVSLEDLNARPEAVRDLGRHLGAQYVVLGRLSTADVALDGQVRIVEVASGEDRSQTKIGAPVEQLPTVVDAIAAELVQLVGGELKSTRAGPPVAALEATTRALMILRDQSLSPRAANPGVDLQVSAERLAQARALAEQASQAAPDFPCAWVALALCAAMADDPAQANEHLERASKAAPRPGPLFTLVKGFVLMRQGRFDVAEVLLRDAVQAHPGFLHGRGSLAELLLHFGRLRESRAAFRRYLALAPDHPWVMVMIAYADAKLGEVEQAVEQTRQAVALVPDSTFLLTELASRQIDADDLAGAQATLERVLELAPDLARAQVRLGYVKLLRGDDEGAIAISLRVLEMAKGSRNRRDRSYAHLNLARAYGHQGKLDESLAQLALARKEAEISLDEFEEDEALKPVREDPRYMQIVD